MTAKFQVLAGKALASAIAGRAKAVATFTEREHQLAYSALNHADLHNDPKYLNALYEVTPANYRRGLSSWALAFGNVTFDVKASAFVYAKGKKSDLAAAMEIAPANYQKEQGSQTEAAFDEVAFVERALKKLEEKGANPRLLQAMRGVVNVAKGATLEPAKPAAIVKPAAKKAPKAKAAPAPVVAEVQQAA